MIRSNKDIRSLSFYKIRLIVLFALLILSSFTSLESFAKESLTTQKCKTHIHSVQVIRADTNNVKLLPTQGWENVKALPDFWNTRWKNYSGSAWYKIQWTHNCPDGTQEPVTLAINHINMAGEVYINDEFLWKDQSLVEPLSRSWHNPRYWILSNSSLKEGQNILWVHVIGTPTQKSGLGPVSLGEHDQVLKIYKKAILEKQTLPILNFVTVFVIGLFCLLVWILLPHEHAFKWFFFVNMAWLIYVACILYPEPFFSIKSIEIDRISIIIFTIYTCISCIGSWRFAQKRFPRIEMFLLLFCILSFIVNGFISEESLPNTLNLFFIISAIIFILKCLTYPYIAYKSNLKEAYFLAIQYLLFLPIAINDAIYMITLKGHILSPYTGPINTLIVGFILAYRLSNNAKSIEQFNKTLEQSVIQAKEDLSVSLNNQHQLAIENVKLQERINLSHDLHDGLGGSISRSMIMLENHDQVEKSQMVSILKLLRNDLRQTIDFGSSQEAKVPETPVLWAAHLRHRFVIIFEEIEISSKWNLLHQWETTPTALLPNFSACGGGSAQ